MGANERVSWLIELDPDFPGPSQLLAHLREPSVLEKPQPGHELWPDAKPPCVAYGTMRTLTRLQRHPKLGVAVFDNYPALRCTSYYRYVYDLLGRRAFIVPMVALPRLNLASMFGEQVFIRSDSNFKLFAAQVWPSRSVADLLDQQSIHREELVVVSEVVSLGQEYRCIFRDGRLVCHSSYPDEPYRPAPAEVIRFAEGVAQRLLQTLGLRMVSVDVAQGSDRLRLVEVGGVNSWGIYGGSPPAFIQAMEAEALERHAETSDL
jgi:hypothetical protein